MPREANVHCRALPSPAARPGEGLLGLEGGYCLGPPLPKGVVRVLKCVLTMLFFFCGVAGRGDAKTHQNITNENNKINRKNFPRHPFGRLFGTLGRFGGALGRVSEKRRNGPSFKAYGGALGDPCGAFGRPLIPFSVPIGALWMGFLIVFPNRVWNVF